MRPRCPLGLLVLILAAASPAFADVRLEMEGRALGAQLTREVAVHGTWRRITTRGKLSGVLRDVHAREHVIEIARGDRKVVWDIDPVSRTYREVSCEQLKERLAAAAHARGPLRQRYRAGNPQVEVGSAAGKRQIAGLDCERVQARLAVPITVTESGEQATVRFTFDLWVTHDPRVLEPLAAFETAYTQAVGANVTLAEVEALAGQWSDVFVTHVPGVLAQVRARGYPMRTELQVTWENVPTRASEKPRSTTIGELVTEVRRVSFDALPDAEFDLPQGYARKP
ncbi:MAG: hypothetical protein HY320_07300 [Armatimonadetes bacterium]|nr:hypothetical protein [Armatimonadota bacterium]